MDWLDCVDMQAAVGGVDPSDEDRSVSMAAQERGSYGGLRGELGPPTAPLDPG